MKAYSFEHGDVINGVTFIRVISDERPKRALFKCSCGRSFKCIIRSIVSGNTKSCGCWGAASRSARFTVHGLRNHSIYSIWCGIKTRCYNKNRLDYKYYGGMGVTLSNEFSDFLRFYEYVIGLPDYENKEKLKLTIDRIDASGNYERGNLRWATRKQQSLNQRRNSAF